MSSPSGPVTEVLLCKVKPGTSLSSLRSSTTGTLLAQPGCTRARLSPIHEDPSESEIRIFVDWDSRDAHGAFERAPVYAPFTEAFASTLAAPPVVFHCPLNPPRPPVLEPVGSGGAGGRTSVIEMILLYFPADRTEQQLRAVDAGIAEFLDALREIGPEGYTGEVAGGWSLEKLPFKKEGQGQGEEEEETMARTYFALLGWDSVEAHLRFRETEEFGKVIPIFRGLEGLRGSQIVHVI